MIAKAVPMLDLPRADVLGFCHDIVVRGHQVEVHNSFGPGRGTGNWIEEDAGEIALHDESRGAVLAEFEVAQRFLDLAGCPTHFA